MVYNISFRSKCLDTVPLWIAENESDFNWL